MAGKRSVFFDIETTSLDIHTTEIIEIFALEMIDDTPTGRCFHRLIKPRSNVPSVIETLTGLNSEKLKDKPSFKDIKKPLLRFIGDGSVSNAKKTMLGAHNVHFDAFILNRYLMSDEPKYELRTKAYLEAVDRDLKANFTTLERDLGGPGIKKLAAGNQVTTIDTMRIVGQMNKVVHPSGRRRGQPKWPNLEESCGVLKVDASARKQHGAAIDTMLAVECYLSSRGVEADDPKRQKTRESCRPYFRKGLDAISVPSVEHPASEARSKSDAETISPGGGERSAVVRIGKRKSIPDVPESKASPEAGPASVSSNLGEESNGSANRDLGRPSKKRKADTADEPRQKRRISRFDRPDREIGRGV